MQAKQFWTKAYQRNIGKMIGTCYRYVGNRVVAEDLAHEAFLKAIEKSESYRRIGSFDGWLMRINLNTTLDYLRRQPQFLSVEESDVGTTFVASEQTDAVIEDTSDFTYQLNNLSESEILDAVCALPERQRTVFNLYVFENKTHTKISEMMQIGVRSSKRYLSEARTQLQNTLKDMVHQKKKGLMILLPILPWKSHAMDRLCRAKLQHLTLSPATPSPLSSLNWATAPKPGVWMAITAVKAPIVATGVVAAAVTGSVIAYQTHPVQQSTLPTAHELVSTTGIITDSTTVDNTVIIEKEFIESDSTDIGTRPSASAQALHPEQQVKGTESSVSPLPTESRPSVPISYHSLKKFERNGYYGLQDEKKNEVASPKYTDIQPFDVYRTGWAMVEIFGFKGFVDTSGKEVVHPQYEEIGPFVYQETGPYMRQKIALVRKGNFYGFIDISGNEIMPLTRKRIDQLPRIDRITGEEVRP